MPLSLARAGCPGAFSQEKAGFISGCGALCRSEIRAGADVQAPVGSGEGSEQPASTVCPVPGPRFKAAGGSVGPAFPLIISHLRMTPSPQPIWENHSPQLHIVSGPKGQQVAREPSLHPCNPLLGTEMAEGSDLMGQSPKGPLGHRKALGRPSGGWGGTSWATGQALAKLSEEAV